MQEKCLDECPALTRLEQQMNDLQKQNGDDHKEIRERLSKVEITNAVQNEKYDTIMVKLNKDIPQKIDEITQSVRSLELKPGKRWDGIVEKAIWAIAAAIIAYFLTKAGIQ